MAVGKASGQVLEAICLLHQQAGERGKKKKKKKLKLLHNEIIHPVST